MSAAELVSRSRDTARRQWWKSRQVSRGNVHDQPDARALTRHRAFGATLAPGLAATVAEEPRKALLDTADRILEGEWTVLGVTRHDLHQPDWFLDPVSGKRAPQDAYAFSINHRSEHEVGNIKQVWELSRHHHLSVLAAAWFLTGDDRYAEVAAGQLRSWWQDNPFLSGVHWTSGIEVGIRLISWVWIRRLLDGWAGVGDLFDSNEVAARQIGWHQEYLAAFRSTGSSANNHVIAEAAGQLVASCAFPWFPESQRWRTDASRLLEHELEANTYPSGINRELASEYHCLVTELALVAAAEAQAAGYPLGEATWAHLARGIDAAAAIVDERLAGPRQGDGDDGRALLLDAPRPNHWPSLLGLGADLISSLPWWPPTTGDVRSTVVAALGRGTNPMTSRPLSRPWNFADAGLTILRSAPEDGPEIWCRCDAGPHGFLSLAAHAHADALSVEVRRGGVEVLVDPGTYCYHGEAEWRTYFRSTHGHNTLELADQDQSLAAGPFLWATQASTRLLATSIDADARTGLWSAEHDGYGRLDPPAVHRRTVRLDGTAQNIRIVDQVVADGHHRCRLAFHLGPTVDVALEGAVARLTWPTAGLAESAVLSLPAALEWSTHRGQAKPIAGWYSEAFGRLQPTTTLVGSGTSTPDDLVTVVQFAL